jgi:hypothetical protein
MTKRANTIAASAAIYRDTVAAIDAKLADIAKFRQDFDAMHADSDIPDSAVEKMAVDFLVALQTAWEHATGNDTIPGHVLRGEGARIRNGRIVGREG